MFKAVGQAPAIWIPIRVLQILAMVIKGLRNAAVDTVVNLAASVRYIVLDPEWFGLDRRIVSKIILRMDRDIEQNPRPANVSESFLVKDTMQIGLRLGYGSVISGDVAYSRKYTLVYPVETRDAGRFHDKFIMNLFLPFKNRGRNLPKNHVVLVEDYLEGRGKIRFKTNSPIVELECSLTASKIYLHRRFISFKENRHNKRVIFFEDKSLYDELRFRIFFDYFKIFHSIPFNTYIQKGILNRDYVEMDTSDLEANPRKRKALELLLLEGNPYLLQKTGKQKIIHDRFSEKKSYLKLLGSLRRRSVYRMDRLKETFPPQNTGNVSDTLPGNNHYVQIESRKLKAWRFFDNGERHFSSIRLTGKTDGETSVIEPLLTLSIRVNDRSTHDGELKDGYLFFINTLALKDNFIRFNPSRHTVNRMWTSTQTFVNIILYEEAIENLVHAGEEKIWEALAEVTGRSVDSWHMLSRPRYRRGRPNTGRYSRDRYLAVKIRYFIRELRRARNSRNSLEKMEHVVKAVRKAVYTSGQTYSPTLLAVIHKLVGEENIYMNALVTMPENKELIFPARAPLYNELGTDRGVKIPVFQFIFDDPSDIFHLF